MEYMGIYPIRQGGLGYRLSLDFLLEKSYDK